MELRSRWSRLQRWTCWSDLWEAAAEPGPRLGRAQMSVRRRSSKLRSIALKLCSFPGEKWLRDQ